MARICLDLSPDHLSSCSSPVEILRIGSQVAAGLAAAHDQGLIHRDIKPENILLDEGIERVTLTDFGLARAVDDASVTREGTIAGTPQYMSPEQARGESVDQQSDLFSLGSVMYALCTGRPPFRADSSYGVMRLISDEIPAPIRDLNPDIPEWLAGIIEKLMAKEKAERFDTAGKVHEILEACLSHVQQPAAVKLPFELSAKEEPTFGKHRVLTSFILTIGVLSMISLPFALIFGQFLLEGETQPPQKTRTTNGEVLGHGYTRNGAFIYFDGYRVDEAGKEDIDEFAKFTGLELQLAKDVDAASFKALSEEYSKDKNKVYYKWISPGRFWIVELPKADVKTFEVVGFNLAKDSKSVWWYGSILPEVDASTLEIVNDGFVWKDATSVWYEEEKIADADVKTFRHLEQAFYRDASRVYWATTPLDGADPDTFRTFGDDSPYGADRNGVWMGSTKLTGLDATSFEAVHQSVYKDKKGVYANGNPIKDADPKTFRKVVNLDQHFTALLADANNYYLFLPFRGEVVHITSTADSLKVSRQIWRSTNTPPGHNKAEPIATSTAELNDDGWKELQISADLPKRAIQLLKDQENHLLTIYKEQFLKAREILRKGSLQEMTVQEMSMEEVTAQEAGSDDKPADKDETIASPIQKTTPVLAKPDEEIVKVAKAFLRASLIYDEPSLKQIYATEVRLLPGNRAFEFGLEVPEKMTPSGILINRDKVMQALKKQASRAPIPEPFVDEFVNEFRVEQLDVPVGDFVTQPNLPSDAMQEDLRFTIRDNDALIKISVPAAYRYLQLRKVDGRWKVVAEY